MRYDFTDDPYYQTAKQEKEEMEARERLEDEARELERMTECDACGQWSTDCRDVPGAWTHPEGHLCPNCCDNGPENF